MVVPIIVRNVLTRTPVGTRLFIEQSCLFNLSDLVEFGGNHGWVSSVWVRDPPPPPPCPPGPLSCQGSTATSHTYGGAEGARNFFSFPLPT